MRAARRQPRAVPEPRQAVNGRGIANALAALYSDAPISPERAAAIERELAATPYRKPPQGELGLELPSGEG